MNAFRCTILAASGAACLLASDPARARAQETARDTTTLAPVVVTATRVPVAQPASPVSTTVLTGDALRARGLTTVRQALESVPSAFVPQSGSYGMTTSLFLRGGNSDYTKVLVDGAPVNDPGGALELANLSLDDVDRIEIVRGPASVVYGSDAVTGVVQIFTRSGKGAGRIAIEGRGGTYDTRDVTGTLLTGGERASASLAAASHTTAGIYPFNSAHRDNVFAGLARFAPDSRTDVRAAVRYMDGAAHIATDFTGAVVDSNQFSIERRWLASVDAGRYFTERLALHALLTASDAATRSFDGPDSPSDACLFCFDSRTGTYRRGADVRLDAHIDPRLVLTGGVALDHERQHATGSAPAGRNTWAYYAQAAGSVHDALSYAIGGRIDDNSMFGTFTTYRAALGYRLPTLTRLRLSAGSAFKEPRLDQIFSNTPFAVGNPHLRPEQSRSWEAGIEQELARGRATLGATYFHQRFRDLVQYVPEGTPNYFNVGGARADGVELEARVVPVAPLSVGASYTFLSTEVTDAGADNPPTSPYVTGQPLARRPRRSGSVNVAYRFGGRASASVDVTHVGRRVDFDFAQNTRVEAPAYTITGLAGELTLLRSGTRGSDVTLTARVENLFDARYQAVFGYRSPRRAVLVGARVGAGL